MARARKMLSNGSNTPPFWRLSTQGEQIIVWFDYPRPKRVGVVNRRLAADATRYGQDLVGQLVDKALWETERQKTFHAVRRQ